MNDLTPLALKDAPALIEGAFPAQKISFEAQRERDAGGAQTLTALGAYWKGRKPLILVRAIVLGCLLPRTDDGPKDLEIFEKLLAFDDLSLARRAVAQGDIRPSMIAGVVTIQNPWDYFTHSLSEGNKLFKDIEAASFPLDHGMYGASIRWRQNISDDQKAEVICKFLKTFDTYEEKSSFTKRPEEVDQTWLYRDIWKDVNNHLAAWGVQASSHVDLVYQLSKLRFGRSCIVGDAFCGGGSIPFEGARIGCDVLASDINPVATMLTWGSAHIIGSDPEERLRIEREQLTLTKRVWEEIDGLGIERAVNGDHARFFLYCTEAKCPSTGWRVPILPTKVVSTRSNCIVNLKEDPVSKRFAIEVQENVSHEQLKAAQQGTLQGGNLIYEISGVKYSIPIKTLRGDYSGNGARGNKLRQWTLSDFEHEVDDLYSERLYAIQWIRKSSISKKTWSTYFAAPTEHDLQNEAIVSKLVSENLVDLQRRGLLPDMEIEHGKNTDQVIRERGWRYWHHLFSPRQLLVNSIVLKHSRSPESQIFFARILDFNSKLTTWVGPSNRDKNNNTFSQQKLSTLFNRAERGWAFLQDTIKYSPRDRGKVHGSFSVQTLDASEVSSDADLWITDPPYADAVNYHEITEFFIAWLRKARAEEFSEWTWDSRRALAIKGTGDDFRRGMVDAYRAMAKHMPDNGMQCVMFTHQDTGVWSDMVGIFWAAGLQVVAAWYIATETTSELKKGGYVQGTVILMLRKRPAGERSGFKQRILPAVRTEVERQIESMMHLNDEVKDKLGEPVFNDSDLQMAGYAAALKVLTAYTHIGGDDVTSFALRPRQRGEETVVDEIVQQAAEAANSLLVPEGLEAETWSRLTGIQRFYFRMMDMETTGASKLDNYQNFAKAFRVADYAKVMGNMAANSARLKRVTEFASRDLTDSTEIGPTWLGRLIIGLQQLLAETEPTVVVGQIQEDLPDFLEIRRQMIDMLSFIERKAPEKEVRDAAEVLGGRLKNLRAFSQ